MFRAAHFFTKLKPQQAVMAGLAPLVPALALLLWGFKTQPYIFTLKVVLWAAVSSQILFLATTSFWAAQLTARPTFKKRLVFSSLFSAGCYALLALSSAPLVSFYAICWLLADVPCYLIVAKIYALAENRKSSLVLKFYTVFLLLSPLIGIWPLYHRQQNALSLNTYA